MSFAGIREFRENLDKVMDSKAFKEASPAKQMEMGSALVRSSAGAMTFTNATTTLPIKKSVDK